MTRERASVTPEEKAAAFQGTCGPGPSLLALAANLADELAMQVRRACSAHGYAQQNLPATQAELSHLSAKCDEIVKSAARQYPEAYPFRILSGVVRDNWRCQFVLEGVRHGIRLTATVAIKDRGAVYNLHHVRWAFAPPLEASP